jgi:outer membrane lipoprotein-sorting protein
MAFPDTGWTKIRRRLAAPVAAVILAVAVLAGWPGAGVGADVESRQLSAAERAEVGRIQTYLDSLDTLKTRFIQVASTGQVAEGWMYMRRPGHLRINYDPPSPIELVADGVWLIYHDKSLEQLSHIPLSSTPAAILLDPDVSLNAKDVTVTALDTDRGMIRVTVVQTGRADEGRLTLVLTQSPMQLRQWEVVDAQGVVTTVSLIDPRFGGEIDDSLFRIEQPNAFGEDHP